MKKSNTSIKSFTGELFYTIHNDFMVRVQKENEIVDFLINPRDLKVEIEDSGKIVLTVSSKNSNWNEFILSKLR